MTRVQMALRTILAGPVATAGRARRRNQGRFVRWSGTY
jgi:hypothetical protein